MIPGVDADLEARVAHAAHFGGAAPSDVGPGKQGAVEQGTYTVVRHHRSTPDLLHESRAQRAPDCAAGVIGAKAEEEGRPGAMALKDLDQAWHALARAAEGVDIDFQGEIQATLKGSTAKLSIVP